MSFLDTKPEETTFTCFLVTWQERLLYVKGTSMTLPSHAIRPSGAVSISLEDNRSYVHATKLPSCRLRFHSNLLKWLHQT